MSGLNEIFRTLFSTLKAQVTKIWTKVKLWTSFSFIKSRLIAALRNFFGKILNIKPKNKDDYYPMLSWLISKKLAFALVIIIGLASAWYITTMLPENIFASDSKDAISTYRFDSFALKFQSGVVKILADDNYVAYIGEVDGNEVTGKGQLFDQFGSMVYKGEFSDNKFNGEGQLYYNDGILKYNGSFLDNIYNGEGELFFPTGTVFYKGAFEAGVRSGNGVQYNASGDVIYTGLYRDDEIVFSEMLGKPSSDIGDIYTGVSKMYMTDDGSLYTDMKEIEAAYFVEGGLNTLDMEYTVMQIQVRKPYFKAGKKQMTTEDELTSYFGEPIYEGYTEAYQQELFSIALLSDEYKQYFDDTGINNNELYDDVFQVESYNKEYPIFLRTYEADNIRYSFYSHEQSDTFAFYAIESMK